jgi:hypothetical protein|eukprot:SAG25_NODE_7_length_29214_cov_40.245818_29_plen_54_part_00
MVYNCAMPTDAYAFPQPDMCADIGCVASQYTTVHRITLGCFSISTTSARPASS